MHPLLQRIALAYAPSAGRNALVAGVPTHRIPAPPPPRLTLIALLPPGLWIGR